MHEVWERQQARWAEHCHPAGDLGLSLAEFRSSSSLLPSNVQVGDEADAIGGAEPAACPSVVGYWKGSVGVSRSDCKSLSWAMQFSILLLNPPPSRLNPQDWLTWRSEAGAVTR